MILVKVNYFLNWYGLPVVAPSNVGYVHFLISIEGVKICARGPKFAEHFNQAGLFYNSLVNWEKDHLTNALIFELSHVDDQAVKERVVNQILNYIDHKLAVTVAIAIGVQPPNLTVNTNGGRIKYSPSLSQTNYSTNSTIETRKVAFLITEGFNSTQAEYLSNYLLKNGAFPVYIAPRLGKITSSRSAYFVFPNATFTSTKSVLYDAVVIVGGKTKNGSLADYAETSAFVKEAFKHGKPIIATGEGVLFVDRLGLPCIVLATDKKAVETSFGVVSSVSFSNPEKVAKAMFDAIAAHRHFDRDVSKVAI